MRESERSRASEGVREQRVRESTESDDTSGMGAAIAPGPREEAQKCKDSIEAIKQRAGTQFTFFTGTKVQY